MPQTQTPYSAPNVALYQNAILVDLDVTDFTPVLGAEEIVAEAASKHKADINAITARKRYITNEDMAPVKAAVRELRKFFRDNTLAYHSADWRLLPTIKHLEFTQGIQQRQDALEKAATDFIALYKKRLNDTAYMTNLLGDLHDPTLALYMTPEKLENERFKVDLKYNVVPLPQQIQLANLPQEQIEEIRRSTTKQISAGAKSALDDIFTRIREGIGTIKDRASEPDSVFRWALIDNVNGLIDLLPKLNFLSDQPLDKLADELKAQLDTIVPTMVKRNDQRRATVVETADNMLSTLMSAMGSNP